MSKNSYTKSKKTVKRASGFDVSAKTRSKRGILVQGEHSSASSFLNGKQLPATEEVLVPVTQAAERSPCSETSETPHKTIKK